MSAVYCKGSFKVERPIHTEVGNSAAEGRHLTAERHAASAETAMGQTIVSYHIGFNSKHLFKMNAFRDYILINEQRSNTTPLVYDEAYFAHSLLDSGIFLRGDVSS